MIINYTINPEEIIMEMNWKSWLQGAIVALATGIITVLTTFLSLDQCPTGWELFKVGIAPTIISFLAYIKQTPPPIAKQ